MEKIIELLEAVFDLSFSEFVITKIIKIIYVLGIIFFAFNALISMGWAFNVSIGFGLSSVIWGPLLFFLSVIILRLFLEGIIVIYRISENTAEIAKQRRTES